ncbi:MAG: hypothetical protein JJ975_08330 [Bacteroidia bacterium]|nr:hypothetical protein [Bacteroidia bacterium]
MRRSLSIILSLLFVFVVSSCGKRQYAHLTGFQFNGKTKKEKVKTYSHYVHPKQKLETTAEDDQDHINEVIDNTDESVAMDNQERVMDINLLDATLVVVSKKAEKKRLITPKVVKPVAGTSSKSSHAKPVDRTLKKIKKKAQKATSKNDGGLIYWILVVLLVLLVLTLLKELLGALYPILILAILIVLIGHLIGLW